MYGIPGKLHTLYQGVTKISHFVGYFAEAQVKLDPELAKRRRPKAFFCRALRKTGLTSQTRWARQNIVFFVRTIVGRYFHC